MNISPRILRLLSWLVAIVVVAVLFAVQQHEQTVRTNQFCKLVVSTHNDKVHRYHNTLDYIESPSGRVSTGLNDYIRQFSLPASRAEIEKEAKLIPKTCREKEDVAT